MYDKYMGIFLAWIMFKQPSNEVNDDIAYD